MIFLVRGHVIIISLVASLELFMNIKHYVGLYVRGNVYSWEIVTRESQEHWSPSKNGDSTVLIKTVVLVLSISSSIFIYILHVAMCIYCTLMSLYATLTINGFSDILTDTYLHIKCTILTRVCRGFFSLRKRT